MIRRRSLLAVLAALGVGLTIGVAKPVAAAGSAAHAHMGHVMEAWKDTPEGKGLLPTAFGEADVAQKHVGLALKTPDDLASLQVHLRHVLHALDPAMEKSGPGLGYGLINAAEGASKHTGFAGGSGDASDNVKVHSEHVTTALNNAVAAAKAAEAEVEKGLAASSAADAKAAAEAVQALLVQAVDGKDANGDGSVSWQEGGLQQARQHMGFMYKGEGMEMPAE